MIAGLILAGRVFGFVVGSLQCELHNGEFGMLQMVVALVDGLDHYRVAATGATEAREAVCRRRSAIAPR